jgi:large subunit ribosomal protein L4
LCDETVPVSPESEEAPVNGEVRKEKVEILRRFGTAEDLSVLFLHAPAFTEEEVSRLETFTRVVRNLPGVEVLGTDEVTVWHVLKYRWIVMEGAAVDAVSEEGEWVGEEEFGAEGFIGDETSAEAGVAA